MKQHGLIKRQPAESFVTNLASNLFVALAMSGIWNNIDIDELYKFINEDTTGFDNQEALQDG